MRPLAKLVPEWLPAEHILSFLSFLLVLVVCFPIGLMVRTQAGRAAWGRMENSAAGNPWLRIVSKSHSAISRQDARQRVEAALEEIEQALVPAFIIEEQDGRFTKGRSVDER